VRVLRTLNRSKREQQVAEGDPGIEEAGNNPRNVCVGVFYLARMEERGLRIEDALGRRSRKKLSPMSPVYLVTDVPGCSIR